MALLVKENGHLSEILPKTGCVFTKEELTEILSDSCVQIPSQFPVRSQNLPEKYQKYTIALVDQYASLNGKAKNMPASVLMLFPVDGRLLVVSPEEVGKKTETSRVGKKNSSVRKRETKEAARAAKNKA